MPKRKKIQNAVIPDMGAVASTTDCTGIVPSAPESGAGLENTLDIMKFSPTDVPMKKKK